MPHFRRALALVAGLVTTCVTGSAADAPPAATRHWAFQVPTRPTPPQTRDPGWAKGAIDAFVLARLEREGLRPANPAAPETWLRRVGFDLVGLAPEPGEVDAFQADTKARGEAAYEAAVDRLLASPRYGERQAQEWLDVARYADTHGFNNDSSRTQWRWRDWVIGAFNRGLPYDRFIVEQLAGDLLPHPTLDQRLATGFGRNHVVNSEGGIIGEEYRVEYVADRVRTLGMAWLGLTLECARCHDHKYDPVTMRDYYRLFAYFNGIDEFGEDGRIGNAAPVLPAPTEEQQADLARIETELARTRSLLETMPLPAPPEVSRLLAEATAAPPRPAPPGERYRFSEGHPPSAEAHTTLDFVVELDPRTEHVLDLPPSSFSPAQPWTLAAWVRWDGGEAPLLSTMDLLLDPSAGSSGRGAELRVNQAGRVEIRLAEFWPSYAIYVLSEERFERGQWRHVTATYDASSKASGVRLYLDGRAADLELRRDGLSGRNASAHRPRLGRTVAKSPEIARGAVADLRLYTNVLAGPALAPWIEDRWARRQVARANPTEDLPGVVRDNLLRRAAPAFAAAWEEHERLRERRQEVLRQAPQVMVMAESGAPRPTHVLARGHYDARREAVEPGVPESLLGPLPAGAPPNRLGLARWLTRPDHPLTSRVVMNRMWAQLFGTGLVKTTEDLGIQGETPTHPELLDWLAREFVDTGWSYRRMQRAIVLSATYRQDSRWTPTSREKDPANRLLARGPRVRLPAETLRDHALALGGLLRHRLGGPSVFPAQPETLYAGIVVAADYPGTKWVPSEGDDRYRRGLYTFWKRTVPHPVMTTFDAPDREACTSRRLPTNTPLQALALLNEPAFVEAGHALGLRAWREGGNTDLARATHLCRRALGRAPAPRELASLTRTLDRFRSTFAQDPKSAADLLGRTAPPEEAAWAALGTLMLNLDETITKN